MNDDQRGHMGNPRFITGKFAFRFSDSFACCSVGKKGYFEGEALYPSIIYISSLYPSSSTGVLQAAQ